MLFGKMATNAYKKFRLENEALNCEYYRIDYLLKKHLKREEPRLHHLLKGFVDEQSALNHVVKVTKRDGNYHRKRSDPRERSGGSGSRQVNRSIERIRNMTVDIRNIIKTTLFIETTYWDDLVSQNDAEKTQVVIDDSKFTKYTVHYGNHERMGKYCPGLYFNRIDSAHNLQRPEGGSLLLPSDRYEESDWICKIGKADDMNRRFSEHHRDLTKKSPNIKISTIFRQPVPQPSLYNAEEDVHVMLGKCVAKYCRMYCLSKCRIERGKCMDHPCKHESDYFIPADDFPKTGPVPEEWFVVKNDLDIVDVITKMSVVGERYKESLNERAARAEAQFKLLTTIREEEKDRIVEERKEEKDRFREERKEYQTRFVEERKEYQTRFVEERREERREDQDLFREIRREDQDLFREERKERILFQQRYADLLQKISLLSLEQQRELEDKFQELKGKQNKVEN
jgi:hypothetical protein